MSNVRSDNTLPAEGMVICPDCNGEGEIDMGRCDGDCYEGANRLCSGPDEGGCRDGYVYLQCCTCEGEGQIPRTSKIEFKLKSKIVRCKALIEKINKKELI